MNKKNQKSDERSSDYYKEKVILAFIEETAFTSKASLRRKLKMSEGTQNRLDKAIEELENDGVLVPDKLELNPSLVNFFDSLPLARQLMKEKGDLLIEEIRGRGKLSEDKRSELLGKFASKFGEEIAINEREIDDTTLNTLESFKKEGKPSHDMVGRAINSERERNKKNK